MNNIGEIVLMPDDASDEPERPAHVSPSGIRDYLMAARGLGKGAETYADQLILKFMGVPEDDYLSYDMERGLALEPIAIEAYEQEFMVSVTSKERTPHPDYRFISGEMDGKVGEHGIIEVKCPNPKNHLRNLMFGEQIKDYINQIQAYLWIGNRHWCDFVSYNPDFPVGKQLYVKRIYRDEDTIDLIEARSLEFWSELFRPRLRQALGYENKVAEHEIIDIIYAHKEGYTMKSLAYEFGVSPSMISAIVRRKTYKHVQIP